MQYSTEYFTLYHLVLNLLGIQCGLLGVEFSFNAPTWFVSVLLVCYVLYWLILYLLRHSKEAIPCFYMIMAVLGGALILKDELSEPFFNVMIGRGLLNFFIGAILGRIYRWRKNFNEKLVGYLVI